MIKGFVSPIVCLTEAKMVSHCSIVVSCQFRFAEFCEQLLMSQIPVEKLDAPLDSKGNSSQWVKSDPIFSCGYLFNVCIGVRDFNPVLGLGFLGPATQTTPGSLVHVDVQSFRVFAQCSADIAERELLVSSFENRELHTHGHVRQGKKDPFSVKRLGRERGVSDKLAISGYVWEGKLKLRAEILLQLALPRVQPQDVESSGSDSEPESYFSDSE